MRSFVVDGNFTADHIKLKRAADDVWLTDGEGMMTARDPYKAHLAVAIETKEVGKSMKFLHMTLKCAQQVRSRGEPFPGHR
jgi:hypothetical protein